MRAYDFAEKAFLTQFSYFQRQFGPDPSGISCVEGINHYVCFNYIILAKQKISQT